MPACPIPSWGQPLSWLKQLHLGEVAASGRASVVPTFFCSCSNTSCGIRPSGKNWFAPKTKAQPYPTVQQPLPRVPCAMCGCSPGHGVLCLWDGKEEAWKSLPVPLVLTHCLSVDVQAYRLPTDAEGKLLPCLPTTFCCSVPHLCLCPRTALAKGIPHMAPWQLEDVSGARTAWLREFQLHIHGPCLSLLPGAGRAGSCHPLPGCHCQRGPTRG